MREGRVFQPIQICFELQRIFGFVHKHALKQRPLFGRSGRRLIVGPGHARTGTQIARFGTTPGGYLGG
jgi:hypothetical protein